MLPISCRQFPKGVPRRTGHLRHGRKTFRYRIVSALGMSVALYCTCVTRSAGLIVPVLHKRLVRVVDLRKIGKNQRARDQSCHL